MKRKKIQDDDQEDKRNQKPNVCASCNKEGHQRSSSTKCDNYKPRQGKTKPKLTDEDAEDKFYKKATSVYKEGLRTLLANHPNFSDGTTLEERIHEQVYKVTRNAYYATRLLQYHIQRCMENNLAIPNILSRTWIRQIFTHKFTDPDLAESRTLLGILIPPLQTGVIPQIITIFCREYVVNIQVYLDSVYNKMHKKWIRKVLEIKGLPSKQCNQITAYIYNNADNEECNLIAGYPTIIGPWKTNAETPALKLQRIYHLNTLFHKWCIKLYNLVPQYTSQAKYITVDTDILYDLVKSDLAKGSDIKSFGALREDRWKEYTNIRPKYFKGNKRFNCEIKTDGVGCSIVLIQWQLLNKAQELTEAEKQQKRMNKLEAHLRTLPPEQEIRWVGADPGRKDILSASDEDGYRFTLTSKRYYSSSKFIKKREWKLQ